MAQRVVGLLAVALAGLAMTATQASAESSGLMVWGGSELSKPGLLGNGTTSNSDFPVGVSGLASGVTSVSAGYTSGVAALEGGTAVAWGGNRFGQLGTGTSVGPETCGEACSRTPVAISALSNVKSVSSGLWFDLALRSDGTVAAWGENNFGQLGDETHTGPEFCATEACSTTPATVSGLSEVVAIAAGGYHSLALLSNGKVMAWGRNTVGQLGNGTTEDSDVPIEVKGLSGVVAISAGYAESMALLSNGKVMAWGGNGHGQLGQGEHPTTGPEVCGPESEPCSTSPVEVPGLSEVTAVEAGYWNAVALMSNGTVKTWGNNARGQLGTGTSEGPEVCPFPHEPCSSAPLVVSGLSNVEAIAASKDTEVLALQKDGTIKAWGASHAGQLGDGNHSGPETCASYPCSTKPVAVSNIVGATSIAAGLETGFALVPPNAPPEFGRCVKVDAGTARFEDSGCTKAGGGREFEWYSGVSKTHFTSATAAEATVTLETTSKEKVSCKAESNSGEYAGTKRLDGIVVRLTGCETTPGGVPCNTLGYASGELVSSALSGTLGWRSISEETLAIELAPAEAEGLFFSTYHCGVASIRIRGAVLGQLVAAKMLIKPSIKFVEAGGEQQPKHFDGGPTTVLEQSVFGGEWQQLGLKLATNQADEEKVEANPAA
jgi:alpha-tubulin suppressor-like RCC1 family protein